MQNIPYIMDDYLWSRAIKMKKNLSQLIKLFACGCGFQNVHFINVKNRRFIVYGHITWKVSIWVGDRLGISGAVDFCLLFSFFIIYIFIIIIKLFFFFFFFFFSFSFFLFDSILFLLFLYK